MKYSIGCETVKDLMPLYIDGVASKDSAALIGDHLKTCSSCREYRKTCLISAHSKKDETVQNEKSYSELSKKLKKRRRVKNGIGIIILTASALIALLSALRIFGNPAINDD